MTRLTLWRLVTIALWLIAFALIALAFIAIARGETNIGGGCMIAAVIMALGGAMSVERTGI